MIDKKIIHYRIPLKLITSYLWAGLNQSAKAILPVIGVHYNKKDGSSFPSIKLMAKLAGYKDKKNRNVQIGINDLIKNVLMSKKKEGRHNVYFLTDLALWKKGRSFLPIYKEAMILNGFWAKFTPIEKALYIVIAEKAKINDPEAIKLNYYAIGNIKNINKICKLAGISKPSFYTAYKSLRNKGYIEFNQDEKYRYGIVNFSGQKRVDKNKDNLRKASEIIDSSIKKIDILKVIPKTAYQKQVDFENKKKAALEIAEKLKRVFDKGNIEGN